MIRIENIDNIIEEIVWKKEQEKMKIEFFKYAKIWVVKKSDWTLLQKEEYKKYDSTVKKWMNLKYFF